MAEVTVSYTGNTDLNDVRIDDRTVLLGTGETSVKVTGGPEHSVTYFVRGVPGSRYELKVSVAKEVKFSRSAVIDGSTKDAGVDWITVDGSGK